MKLIELICEHCKCVFKKELRKHKYESKKFPRRLFFCSSKCVKDYNSRNSIISNCEWCSKEITRTFSSAKKSFHLFCSQSCSTKYVTVKRFCIVCNTQLRNKNRKTCSNTCLKVLQNAAGLKSAQSQSQTRRSKNEILFSELCIAHFGAYDIITNDPLFSNDPPTGTNWDCDVAIHSLKLAVLWNGAWHKRKLRAKHSPKQVQSRDKIKINRIEACGWIPYVIEDPGKHNPKFVQEKFEEFLIYIQKKQCHKILK